MLRNLFVIIDYNLSRVEDVKIMTRYAKNKYHLETVLIRKNPGVEDRLLADHVIDLDPLDAEFVEKAVALIALLGRPRAILPFSDNAVASGAAVAERLGALADSSTKALNAFSKIAYREAETQYLGNRTGLDTHDPERITAVKWMKIGSFEDVEAFASRAPHGFVIKPSCEGNNRGVVKVMPGDDLHAAFKAVEPYLSYGVLCEELIDFKEEYSYDGLGSLWFITRKHSANGRYPVELGQELPAKLPRHLEELLVDAGSMANDIVGQKSGPFHNEIKLSPLTEVAAVVEPNRRPAGMRIWHLAQKVYGINFFHRWVDTMLGQKFERLRCKSNGTAAIRMLVAPCSGWLSAELDPKMVFEDILNLPEMQKLTLEHKLEWFDFQFSRVPGSYVTDLIDDNSKFMGHVCVYSPLETFAMGKALSLFEKCWSQVMLKFITIDGKLGKEVAQ